MEIKNHFMYVREFIGWAGWALRRTYHHYSCNRQFRLPLKANRAGECKTTGALLPVLM